MNTLGRLFRVSILGESHGFLVGVLIDGCPSGIALSEADFTEDISRRKPQGLAGTSRREEDKVLFQSGVYQGRSTGAPLLLSFMNREQRSSDYAQTRLQPRPGHSDYVSMRRYGEFADLRGGGHFSGRLTLGLVAAGVVAKKLLPNSVVIGATLSEVGGEQDIERGLSRAIEAQDSVGGIVTCEVSGVPVGIGEPFFDTLEGVLSHALFAIPGVKGVSFGSGFSAARMWGSAQNDALMDKEGHTKTQHAGGITGGLSNGNALRFHLAIKPTSSTPKAQHSFHFGENKVLPMQVKGRHDLCIALRVPVIVEAVSAMVLADMWAIYNSSS